MTESDEAEPDLITIAQNGDLILELKNDAGQVRIRYKVSSDRVITASKYFKSVLQSGFSEGVRFKQYKELLRDRYFDPVGASLLELPAVTIPRPDGLVREDVVHRAIRILLQAVHHDEIIDADQDFKNGLMAQLSYNIDLFAHVAAIADALDSFHTIHYVANQVLKNQPQCRGTPRKGNVEDERCWRQLLYIAYLAKHAKAFQKISAIMIVYGIESLDTRDSNAPWMQMPCNIQEEIDTRRDGLFNTICSIPNSLLKPYMQIDKSKAPLCKLGWGNSPACDSFQLGESFRWLCRRQLSATHLSMILASPDDTEFPYPQGKPHSLIKTLKEFPDYQIDSMHNRCGIKGKMLPLLTAVEELLASEESIGLCLQCWLSKTPDQYSWSIERRPGATPYKGNLLKDLAAIKQFKKTKEAVDKKEDILPEAQALANDSRQLSLLRPRLIAVYMQSNSLAQQAALDSMTNLQLFNLVFRQYIGPGNALNFQAFLTYVMEGVQDREEENGQDKAMEPQGPEKVTAAGMDTGKASTCPYSHRHELYAKIFTAEKWTQKIWLTGDETA